MKNNLITVLDIVAQWFKYNKLSLNLKKTNFMIFETYQQCKHYDEVMIAYNDIPIQRVL